MAESLLLWLSEIVYIGLTEMGRQRTPFNSGWHHYMSCVHELRKKSEHNHSLLSLICECVYSVTSCLSLMPPTKTSAVWTCDEKMSFKLHLLHILCQ